MQVSLCFRGSLLYPNLPPPQSQIAPLTEPYAFDTMSYGVIHDIGINVLFFPQLSVPWKSILTCIPYWSAIIAMSFYACVYLMLLTKIPTYLATVLKFSISNVRIL